MRNRGHLEFTKQPDLCRAYTLTHENYEAILVGDGFRQLESSGGNPEIQGKRLRQRVVTLPAQRGQQNELRNTVFLVTRPERNTIALTSQCLSYRVLQVANPAFDTPARKRYVNVLWGLRARR